MMHFVLHVDTEDNCMAVALRNAENALKALDGAPASIVIVANGPAVKLLGKDDPTYAARVGALIEKGVSIRACNNSMNDFSLARDFICPGCEVVPAAILELVRLQHAGYAYVKP